MVPERTEVDAGEEQPWPDVESARVFLRSLVYRAEPSVEPGVGLSEDSLAPWLAQQGLSSLAYRRYKASWPALAEALRGDYFVTAAKNSLHMRWLARISDLFTQESIPIVLLKGAALSHSVYRDIGLRPMSDLDLWVRAPDMPAAARLMVEAGFVVAGKEKRPAALQEMAGGELAFVSPDRGFVELHWAPFSGWWLHYTTHVDDAALWDRLEILELARNNHEGSEARLKGPLPREWKTLSTEDTILHLAWHLGINHQFGMWPVRSLVDIALILQSQVVDWDALIKRAKSWHLATVLWSVLQLVEQLIGHDDLEPVLGRLRPKALRCRLLALYVTPQVLLAGTDMSKKRARYAIMLLLIDRPMDIMHLVYRTLWPEQEWLGARYGEERASHWRHLWRVVRREEI